MEVTKDFIPRKSPLTLKQLIYEIEKRKNVSTAFPKLEVKRYSIKSNL